MNRAACFAPVLLGLALFAAAALGFDLLLAHCRGVLDIDALYHYRLASLVREQGHWVDVSWLPFTVLGTHGPDHHFLFHLLLAPLTVLGDDEAALRHATALTGAGLLAALFALLRGARVPWAAGFATLALTSAAILPFRFLSLRAQGLALVLTLAVLLALAARRWWWAALGAFLFMQAYHGAVILVALPFAVLAGERARGEAPQLRGVLAVLIGAGLGLVLNPWFPDDVRYLVFHTFFKAAIGNQLLAGNEWLPTTFAHIAREAWPAHLALGSGLAAHAWRRPGHWPRVDTCAALLMTLLFLAMYRFAWRFAEYYAPFAVIAGALAWRDALSGPRAADRVRAGLAAALALLCALGAWRGADRMLAAQGARFDAYAAFMARIEQDDPAPVVFNSHWPDFVQLFHWSRRARFVAGLDGHYLLYGQPGAGELWLDIVSGRTLARSDNARRIRATFDAGWIVLPRGHAPLARTLRKDSDATLVMENEDGWLFRLRCQ